MSPEFITTLEKSEKDELIDSLCNFVDWINERQNYLYNWNPLKLEESDFLKSEKELEDFSNNIKMYVIWVIVHEEKIAYLNNMQINTITKWIEYYRQPRFLRIFSEKINKLLWYNG